MVKLIGNAPSFVVNVVEKLNTERELSGKKYRLYTSGFGENDGVPHFFVRRDNTILWLGGKKSASYDEAVLNQFDFIFVTSPILREYLAQQGISSFYIPEGLNDEEFAEKIVTKRREVAVIGNPSFVEDILVKKNIPYRHYEFDVNEKEVEEIAEAKAVFVGNYWNSKDDFSIPKVILYAAARKVPLVGYWGGEHSYDPMYVFNDYANFYMFYDDAAELIDQVVEDDLLIKKRTEKNRKFVFRYFSEEQAVKDIKTILLKGEKEFPKANKGKVTLDIPTMVGHYGAGDYWLAHDFETFISDKYDFELSYSNSIYKETGEISVYLRGFLTKRDLLVPKDCLNVLYLIYPGFNIDEEIQFLEEVYSLKGSFDLFFSASKYITIQLRKLGINALYLPQFTNEKRFYFDYDDKLATEVLFIGNYHFYRQGILWALEVGIPITIYGAKWKGKAKAGYVDNRVLRQYYSSAKIVLNDTSPLMRKLGFISNRIFDATACGSLVISDYMPEIEEIYGDAVPMYKTKEELKYLVEYYLDPKNEKERTEKAKRAQNITLSGYTSEKILSRMLKVIEEVQRFKSSS